MRCSVAHFCTQCGIPLAIGSEAEHCPLHGGPALAEGAQIRCPSCKEPILAQAKKCRYCGEIIGPQDVPTNDVYPDMIPSSIAWTIPAMVRSELRNMPPEKQRQFLEEYTRRAKRTSSGYLRWLVGFHYAYVRKWGVQLSLFLVTLGALWMWWIVDFFRIPSLVDNYNKDVAISVLRDLKAIGD